MSRQNDTFSPEARQRLEELLADEALGNLDSADAAELRRANVDGNAYHTVVAALGEAMIPRADMPLALQKKIETTAARFVAGGGAARDIAPQQSFNLAAWAGWGIAAAACAVLAFNLTRPAPPPQVVERVVVKEVPAPTPAVPTPVEARAAMLADRGGVLKADWSAGNTPDKVAGDIVWSADKQSGFMRLAGLPQLPTGFQYQLWIIDAAREGQNPVDGGVFDINSAGEVIVPFSAKLKVSRPAAFAITIERAGGVPVSKQEKVAALAKPA
jgi:anti-sigma-K factor RskA